MFGETLECTVPWGKVEVCQKAIAVAAQSAHKQLGLPGKAVFCSRITQQYEDGVCMYSTIAIPAEGVSDPVRKFDFVVEEAKKRVVQEGCSVSHHHGIGKLRKDLMPLIH